MPEFEKMINENAFIENAKFGDNRYGTSKMTIENLTKSGRVVVLDIEMEVCSPNYELLLGDIANGSVCRVLSKSRIHPSKLGMSSSLHRP